MLRVEAGRAAAFVTGHQGWHHEPRPWWRAASGLPQGAQKTAKFGLVVSCSVAGLTSLHDARMGQVLAQRLFELEHTTSPHPSRTTMTKMHRRGCLQEAVHAASVLQRVIMNRSMHAQPPPMPVQETRAVSNEAAYSSTTAPAIWYCHATASMTGRR